MMLKKLFFICVFIFCAIANVCSQGLIRRISPGDSLADIINYNSLSAKARKWASLDINLSMDSLAMSMLGKPYVASTLEIDTTKERLIVNLRQFDCLTFVENVLALSLDARNNNPCFKNFCNCLENIRYRNGVCNGYVSRLHYACDWIYDNCRRNNVSDLTQTLGGQKLETTINYMSTHPWLYKQLRNNASNVEQIKAIEDSINNRKSAFYIPKSQIGKIDSQISSGNIIFISTSLAGLDYGHTGIAHKADDGQLYMIHASSTNRQTILTPVPLKKYLEGMKNFSGIAVLKVNN